MTLKDKIAAIIRRAEDEMKAGPMTLEELEAMDQRITQQIRDAQAEGRPPTVKGGLKDKIAGIVEDYVKAYEAPQHGNIATIAAGVAIDLKHIKRQIAQAFDEEKTGTEAMMQAEKAATQRANTIRDMVLPYWIENLVITHRPGKIQYASKHFTNSSSVPADIKANLGGSPVIGDYPDIEDRLRLFQREALPGDTYFDAMTSHLFVRGDHLNVYRVSEGNEEETAITGAANRILAKVKEMMQIPQGSEEPVLRYEHKAVQASTILTDPELIKQAEEAVAVGEFTTLQGMPGTYRRVDNKPLAPEGLPEQIWSRAMEEAIKILEESDFHLASYVLKGKITNDPRWREKA